MNYYEQEKQKKEKYVREVLSSNAFFTSVFEEKTNEVIDMIIKAYQRTAPIFS